MDPALKETIETALMLAFLAFIIWILMKGDSKS